MKPEDFYMAMQEVNETYLAESEGRAGRGRVLRRGILIAAAVAIVGGATALAVTMSMRDAARADMGANPQQIEEWTEYEAPEKSETATTQLISTMCAGEQLTAYLQVSPVSPEIGQAMLDGGESFVASFDAEKGDNASLGVWTVAYDAQTESALVKVQLDGAFLLEREAVEVQVALPQERAYGAITIPITPSGALTATLSCPIENEEAAGTIQTVRILAGYVEVELSIDPLPADASPEEEDAYCGAWLEAADEALAGLTLEFTDGTTAVVADLETIYAGNWVGHGGSMLAQLRAGRITLCHVLTKALDLDEISAVTLGGARCELRPEN